MTFDFYVVETDFTDAELEQARKWCHTQWPSRHNGPRWGTRRAINHVDGQVWWFSTEEDRVLFMLTWV